MILGKLPLFSLFPMYRTGATPSTLATKTMGATVPQRLAQALNKWNYMVPYHYTSTQLVDKHI